MAFYKQSTAYTRMFKMIDSSDHFSKKTGLTCTVNLSKAGGSFGAAGGTITEVANGWYKIALTTTDTNTLGDLAFYITATGADDTDFVDQITVRDIADLAFPATSGRSMVVDASGLVDANMVKMGPTGAGIAQTARDIGTSVLLSSGTGTGQVKLSSGYVAPNWGDVGNPTTTVALTGTTIAVTQKVDVDTIKTNPVVNAGTVTFPTNATLASTTNITAGTITTVTNLTNAPTSGDFTATMKTSIGTAVAASAVASVTGNVGGNVTGSVGSVVGLTASNLDATISSRLASASYTVPDNTSITAIKAKTDSLTFTVAGQVDSNAKSMNSTTINGTGISGDLWRGA